MTAIQTCPYHYRKSTKNSAAGPDEIPPIFLQKPPFRAKSILTELFNLIFSSQKFPPLWREAIIIPILKENKPKNLPSSYHPISLTYSICKILENILNNRLKWHLQKLNYFSSIQSGYRKGRSTTDNIVLFETEIHEAFMHNQHLVAIFFNINKAFDTT